MPYDTMEFPEAETQRVPAPILSRAAHPLETGCSRESCGIVHLEKALPIPNPKKGVTSASPVIDGKSDIRDQGK